jgi:anti-sigma factor (TIGR02949 family)
VNRSPFSSEGSKCRDRARLLDAYLDGELEPAQLLDVEGHVDECGGCRERVELDRATRASLKRTMKKAAPSDLRARALAAMQAEQVRGEARVQAQPQAGAWRSLVPLATAAAFALVFGALERGQTGVGTTDGSQHAGMGDALLDELIAEHSRPVPSYDRTDPEKARDLEQYVGVPVRPAAFERSGAHFVGGRVMPVSGAQRAAMLQYVIGTGATAQHVSVFIYDPSKIQVSAKDLSPRSVGTAQVRVGRDHGYSVAVTQNGGVGYAVASDLDAEHSAELAAMANQE